MLVDIGLKFYAVPSWPTLIDLVVEVTDLEILCLNFWLKFIYVYINNMSINQVDTLHEGRCWSKVLCSTTTIYLEVKVTDLKFWVKVLVKLFIFYKYICLEHVDVSS